MALRQLVLIRHAKSAYPLGVEDHERPLSERGERDAPQIGRWLTECLSLGAGEQARVIVSSARRAQQTWTGLATALEGPWADSVGETDARIYEAAPSTLREVVEERRAHETVVVVGHNPGLLQLISELGLPSPVRSDAIAKFPTSAVAVLVPTMPPGEALRAVGSFEVSSFAIPRG